MINNFEKLKAVSKQPPNAIEVEASVLGAMMIDTQAVPKVTELLQPEHFYSKKHALIYESMLTLFNENEPIDSTTIYNELKKSGKIEEAGGVTYLSQLSNDISSSVNIEFHCKLVLEKWIARKIISVSMNAAGSIYEDFEDVLEILDNTLVDLYSINSLFQKKQSSVISIIGKKVLQHLENIKKGDISGFALKSGFHDLDEKIIGFKNGELTIVAARPSMGKTSFLLKLSKNFSEKKWGAIFSLEMSDEALYTRLLSREIGITFNNLISGNFTKDKWADLSRGIHKLNNQNIIIDDTAALSTTEFQSKARRLKNEYNIGWIGVDYLQLMTAKAGNREQEISQITQTLKAVAKELNIPVIALSQLNRSVELRNDKTPKLSDLRESGAIEQEADLVLFLYRPEVYGLTVHENIDTDNLAMVIIGKQRNGVLGTIKLIFLKETMSFENYQESSQYDKFINYEEELPI